MSNNQKQSCDPASKDVVYPSVEWALLQGDRCRNYGPEHTRVENENVIVILADEVERLRPMAESRESYEAAQEREGSAVETQPVASNLVRKLRDAAWRYHPESVLAATLNVAAAEIEKLNGTRAALTRLMKAITHSGIAYEVPDIKKSQEIIHAYHDARELLESLPVETTPVTPEFAAGFERGMVAAVLKELDAFVQDRDNPYWHGFAFALEEIRARLELAWKGLPAVEPSPKCPHGFGAADCLFEGCEHYVGNGPANDFSNLGPTDLACEGYIEDPHSRFCDRCGYPQREHKRTGSRENGTTEPAK